MGKKLALTALGWWFLINTGCAAANIGPFTSQQQCEEYRVGLVGKSITGYC